MYVIALAILTGCAEQTSEPANWSADPVLSPPPGDLTLEVESMAPGHLARMSIEGAEPGERLFVLASPTGIGDGPCPDRMNGSCVDLAGGLIILASGTADAEGRTTLTRQLPDTLSAEMSTGLQAVGLRSLEPAPTSIAADQPLALPVMPTLAGQWTDNYGQPHTLTRRDWTIGDSLFAVVYTDGTADDGTHIARNDDDNAYSPGGWSRFDWTIDARGDAWYCQQAFAAVSFEDALATPAADASDPAVTGCGLPPYSFAWSRLDAVSFDLAGEYIDAYGTRHVIDSTTWATDWGVWNITEINPREGFVVAQNDFADPYSPGLWSRFDWTVDRDGHTWYCQTVFAGVSEAAASRATPADPTDPASTGCGGFPWTDLTP